MPESRPRARRSTPARDATVPGASAAPDYTDAFAIDTTAANNRSAEEWIRAIFEGAPLPIRWLLLVGWRVALGLRPGPLDSPRHVLGWSILSTTQSSAVLRHGSGLITARLRLERGEHRLLWTTAVDFESRAAAPIWAAIGLVHRTLVPLLLTRAVRSS